MPKYIIDHMEPMLFKWCILEYRHISQIVGKANLIFTNIKKEKTKLKNLGKVYSEPLEKLNLNLKKACILDPGAKKKLIPKDAKKFNCFIFGGILGDYPPRARTKELVHRLPEVTTRNLGRKQMSTDTAVHVTKLIYSGKKLEELDFQDKIEIPISKGESVMLPYRYLLENKEPVLPPGLTEMLKKQKGF
ncbi:MAG: SAM-dependent methyltransferase [Candidatus Woesearchaeota archaeon]